MKIFKYPLSITSRQIVALPYGSKVLYVAEQYGSAVLYALVTDVREDQDHDIRCVGTGQQINFPTDSPLGVVKLEGGALMFHFFEIK